MTTTLNQFTIIENFEQPTDNNSFGVITFDEELLAELTEWHDYEGSVIYPRGVKIPVEHIRIATTFVNLIQWGM